MKHFLFHLVSLLFTFFIVSQAYAAERVALVIGNDAYKNDKLQYALADAKAVKDRLQQLGFSVVYRENLNQENIDATLEEFRRLLQPDAMALFFYTGHAMQLFGTNYLLSPLKQKLKGVSEVPHKSINLNKVTSIMQEAKTSFNLVLLDSSRRAPVARNIHGGVHGLAKVPALPSTVISFASEPLHIASDGKQQKHSWYTASFLNMLDKDTDLPIEKALQNFQSHVSEVSKGKLHPWQTGYASTNFSFNPEKVSGNTDVGIAVAEQVMNHNPQHGDDFVEPLVGMPFLYINKGDFMMGSPESELNRYRDEELHQVEIKQGFWMGKYEVTFEQYAKFIKDTSHSTPSDNRWGEEKRPVIFASWFDASSFANWLSGKTGHHFRLPTEAEWEYAARAGSNTAFSFGDEESNFSGYAWNGASANNQTHPVGLKKANPWGLHDMHGNVWEWTSSMYKKEYDGSELIDSSLNSSFDDRSVRGGSWYFLAKGMRSADRRLYSPKLRLPYIGFRLVMEK